MRLVLCTSKLAPTWRGRKFFRADGTRAAPAALSSVFRSGISFAGNAPSDWVATFYATWRWLVEVLAFVWLAGASPRLSLHNRASFVAAFCVIVFGSDALHVYRVANAEGHIADASVEA